MNRFGFGRRAAGILWTAAGLLLAIVAPRSLAAERIVLGEEFTATW